VPKRNLDEVNIILTLRRKCGGGRLADLPRAAASSESSLLTLNQPPAVTQCQEHSPAHRAVRTALCNVVQNKDWEGGSRFVFEVRPLSRYLLDTLRKPVKNIS
jgi:hypothetical protein